MTCLRVLIFLAVAVLSTSTGFAQITPVPSEAMPPQKKSAEYNAGYSEGCQHAITGQLRNEVRFKSSFEYHLGWIAGFKNCYAHDTIKSNGDPNGPLKNLF